MQRGITSFKKDVITSLRLSGCAAKGGNDLHRISPTNKNKKIKTEYVIKILDIYIYIDIYSINIHLVA